jgi:DNA-binding transcriptional ArsR family regulator
MIAMATRKKTRSGGALSADERAKIFKALSDPSRVEIVDSLLKHGAQCGTQLAEELGVSLALLCHHWEVLADAGLVKKERVGQLRMCTVDATRLHAATGGWLPSREQVQRRPAVARKRAPSRA